MAVGLRSDLATLWLDVLPQRRRPMAGIAMLMPATALAELLMVGGTVPAPPSSAR